MEDNQNNNDVTFFGATNFRNQQRKFGIMRDDRRRHMYIIGKTGMGKTTMIENMVIQDINNDQGVAYLDPHGDTAEKLLDYIPPSRINDVIYFNPGDLSNPIAFNVLEAVENEHKHLVASGLMGVFTKIWANLWSARMEYILNNTILALLEVPGNTLLGIMRMLADKGFRKKIISRLKDPIVKSFWIDEYANWNERFRTEAIQPIQNKVGQFLSSSIIRNIVGQAKSTIDLRSIMDNRKILIMNLSKGRIGEDASALLGAMMITKIQLAAMSRVNIPNEEDRRDFYLYVDEFQNYSTESFAGILSEARKYRLNLIMAHQYIAQLSDEVRDAVFGNVGTIVTFRVGAEDAEELEKEFTPHVLATDVVNLAKFQIYLKLMIDGVASRPFSADTLPPMQEAGQYSDNRDKVIKVSRERYTKPSDEVEDKIIRWLDPSAVARDTAEGAVLVEDEEIYDAKAKQPGLAVRQERFTAKKELNKEPRPEAENNALCDNCSKGTHINFTPDESRNVFCKDCLKLFKNGEIDAHVLPKRNVKQEEHKASAKTQPEKQNLETPANKKTQEPSNPPPNVKEKSEVEKPQPDGRSQSTQVSKKETQSPELSLNEMLQQQPKNFSKRSSNSQKKENQKQALEPGQIVKLDSGQ
jgi:CxxC-x17-CxxC domain-containing protein